jgi:hypothetical protein
VVISFGVPIKHFSSNTLPPASSRYCETISTGPWPMSTVPFHVPTSVFIRSNSLETGLVVGVSAAFKAIAAASINVAQTEFIFVFIMFPFVCCSIVCPTFTSTTNETAPGGQRSFDFFSKRTGSVKT